MINPHAIAKRGLDLLPDNIHLGRENISLTFQVGSSSTTVDEDGNPIINNQSIVVEGRAVVDKDSQSIQPTPGQDRQLMQLRVNVTSVDSVAGASIPATVGPGDIAIATYREPGSDRQFTGQFYVKARPSYSMPEVYNKVGGILFGEMEVNGKGN